MAVTYGETVGRCIVVKSFIVKNAARSKRKTFLKLLLAKTDPPRVMQTSNHESAVINAHPLDWSLIFVSRMVIRHSVGIDRCTFEQGRIVGTRDVCPDEFIKENDAHSQCFNLGYSRF